MRSAQSRIVIVMIIVGTAPDATGAERVNPESPHQELCQARFAENSMVLLVMVDDKKAENQQSGGNAANDSRHERKDAKRRGERHQEKERSGKHAPPTPQGGVAGVRFHRGNEFRSSSQLQLYFSKLPDPSPVVDRSCVTFLHSGYDAQDGWPKNA